ncbi:MAG: hypothetical protein IJX28_01485 [Clostridia bacterium]|nr:hypothetical protein [Clostridia bacterium]
MKKIPWKRVVRFLLNPRLLFCLSVAWLLTNGWAYLLFAAGTYWGNPWMLGIAGTYLTFLWLPISPEKLLTLLIAVGLLRLLFPKDEQTLGTLRQWQKKLSVKKAKKKEKENRTGKE